jgi:hypothetical protein
MIESNIINMVNLDENMQKIDVYQIPKLVRFFNFFRILLRFKKFTPSIMAFAQCLFFLQVLTLNLVGVNDDKDSVVVILNYISPIIYPNNLITDRAGYLAAVIILLVILLASIGGLILLYISTKKGDDFFRGPLTMMNFFLVFFYFWLYGACIFICLRVTYCPNGVHDLLQVNCYSDITHILCCIVCAVFFLFFLMATMILSIYWNEIGTTGEPKAMARINCNYDTFVNTIRVAIIFLAHFVKFYGDGNKLFTILMQAVLVILSFGLLFYVYQIVFFYNPIMNAVFLYGWVFISWFSTVFILKSIVELQDTAIFLICGWVVFISLIYIMQELREEYILTDLNILEAKALKEIEMFTYKIYGLMDDLSPKNKIMLIGIIHRFEESIQFNEELKDKYEKMNSNFSLKKKNAKGVAFTILRIIYVVYEHHLEKSLLKNDLLLIMAYNLINKFRNVICAVYVCSKVKAVTHKQLYLKYLMMEEVKTDQINKLQKSNNKESVKHIQIGSVILYNTYIDVFRSKIFDAVSNQMEYFETLRSNITTPKTTENFLSIGQSILVTKKQILDYWEKIIAINPFSEEVFQNYILYLGTIVQDDEIAKQESKKFYSYRNSKLSEQSNVYHSMFSINSGVLLVDGWCNFGKVLYATPNLPLLFNFSLKDGANMHIDDVSPNLIREIHREIIEHGVKFTNIKSLFGSPREILLKGKTGSMFNIKVYIKCIPNLMYGLIYVINVTKSSDNNFVILLERDFVINGLTELFSQGTTFSNNPYGIDRSVVSCNVAVVMPSILFELRYNEKEGYHFPRNNIDIKCKLYTLSSNKYINDKIQRIMELIKQRGQLRDPNSFEEDIAIYEELLNEIESKSSNSFNVFYKLITRRLMMGKYIFHRVDIKNDLISREKQPESSNSIPNAVTRGKLKTVSEKNNTSNIQIRINGEAGKTFIDDENEKLIEKDKDKENKKKVEENQVENNNSVSSNSSSSNNSQTNSTSYNLIRDSILQKKEISQVKIMKYLSILFGIGSIILIILSSQNSNVKFTNMNEFLSQNLLFNYSQILVSCTYLNTLNLKLMRDSIYGSDHCYKPCEEIYSTLLAECISEIKLEKENSSYFFKDFKNILSREKEVEIQIYNITSLDKFKIDISNILNLFVSWGLEVKNNIDDYIQNKISIYQTPVDNILIQALNYLNDNLISGFTGSTKQANIDSNFSTFNIILLIEIALFSVVIVAFIYLICNVLGFESFYLKALIKFKTPQFDAYLKILDEIRKKLRNDSDEDGGNVEVAKEEKKSEKSSENDDKKKKKNQNQDGDANAKKGGKKKKAAGINYKEEKMVIMGKYFLYWNVLFVIKVIAILLLSISYYLVVSIIDSSNQSELLKFDSISNDIQAVYRESTDIYVKLKTELARYIDIEVAKRNGISYLSKNTGGSVEILGVSYTKASDYQNIYYKMNLPKQIVTPKIGSLLISLYNSQATSDEITQLSTLYNSDACSILFDKNLSQNDYSFCSNLWSNILLKGMDQAINQMSVVVTTVLDDFSSLNLQKKKVEEIVQNGSVFSSYEMFVEFYLYKSFMRTVDLLGTLSTKNAVTILEIYNILMICYICFISILFLLLIYFVYLSKDIFNNLMNFIGILPAKYIADDPTFYREILRLEQFLG